MIKLNLMIMVADCVDYTCTVLQIKLLSCREGTPCSYPNHENYHGTSSMCNYASLFGSQSGMFDILIVTVINWIMKTIMGQVECATEAIP